MSNPIKLPRNIIFLKEHETSKISFNKFSPNLESCFDNFHSIQEVVSSRELGDDLVFLFNSKGNIGILLSQLFISLTYSNSLSSLPLPHPLLDRIHGVFHFIFSPGMVLETPTPHPPPRKSISMLPLSLSG